jgi:hypothetical protein
MVPDHLRHPRGPPRPGGLELSPGLGGRAASRYGATTPQLLKWFKKYNLNRAYPNQVRPFNFMLAFQAAPLALATCEEYLLDGTSKTGRKRKVKVPLPKPIAPYNSNIAAASKSCFDRETGKPIDAELLKDLPDGPGSISP